MKVAYDVQLIFPQIKHGHIKTDKGWTYGGYSASQTVNQKFIVKVLSKPFLERFCFLLGVLKKPFLDLFVHL